MPRKVQGMFYGHMIIVCGLIVISMFVSSFLYVKVVCPSGKGREPFNFLLYGFSLYHPDVTLLEINKTSFFLKKHKRGFVTLL